MPASRSGAEAALKPLLIADDSEDDRYFLQRLLQKAGLQNPVKIFENGRQVTNFLAEIAAGGERPGILFLDLKMPVMNGHEVLEWIRQRPELSGLKIVVLSGSTLYADMQRAAELGASFYFEKFPSPETLRSVVTGTAAPRSTASIGDNPSEGDELK